MRRKAIGLLLLTLVVVAGVVFVEYGTNDPAADGDKTADSTFRAVLGGGGDSQPTQRELSANARTRHTTAAPEQGDPTDLAPPLPLPTEPEAHEPPAPRRAPSEFRYVVQAGDTLSRIAEDHLGSASPTVIRRITSANGITDPNRIRPGDLLVIPVDEARQHRATGTESLTQIAAAAYGNPARVEALQNANPHLKTTPNQPLPTGTIICIPR